MQMIKPEQVRLLDMQLKLVHKWRQLIHLVQHHLYDPAIKCRVLIRTSDHDFNILDRIFFEHRWSSHRNIYCH